MRLAKLRGIGGGADDPFSSLVGRLVVRALKWHGKLDTTMTETSQGNQLIKFPMHKSHFKLNMIRLIPNLSTVCLQFNKSLGCICRWLIGNGSFKRGGCSRGQIQEVLPTVGLSFVELKGLKGVGRDCGHRLIDTFFMIQENLKVGEDASERVSIGQGRVAVQICYVIHVIENYRDTVN